MSELTIAQAIASGNLKTMRDMGIDLLGNGTTVMATKCFGVDTKTGELTYSCDTQSDAVVTAIIVGCALIGLLFAALYSWTTNKISLFPDGSSDRLLDNSDQQDNDSLYKKVREIAAAISEGANAFLIREYIYMGWFMLGMTALIIVVIGATTDWNDAIFTALAFDIGASVSILSGFIGMRIAVIANSRTCIQARHGFGDAFVTAFKAGCVMGFALASFGVLVLYIMVSLFRLHFKGINDIPDVLTLESRADVMHQMYEAVAGYGLGGSSIALFGRVGGGIYTKAADVGADLCGKLEFDIPEDDPRNPAVIADNVGDNVGDIAGMGADLFGSFAESTCAAMVITAQSPDLFVKWGFLCFPIIISAVGIVICILTSFVATHLMVVKSQAEIEPSLKRQLLVSTVLATPVFYGVTKAFLPDHFVLPLSSADGSAGLAARNVDVFICIMMGLWSGLVIGYVTEYYTSNTYKPVQEVAGSCETGAATNIIYGLALGYKSVIIPIIMLCLTIYISYHQCGMYGISVAAIGILSTMSIGLTIDAYGPICDNAGGIAEMSGMGDAVRQRTDALDAAGNTTAAIGKGFAIGSAALVSLALFGGFVTIKQKDLGVVPLLDGFVFAGLLFGAMLPYWFSAMTMKSVGTAAWAMVQEVRRQFTETPAIMHGTVDPDYSTCVDISTAASLRYMIPPGFLVMGTPLLVGHFIGVKALAGLLAGALVSGVQMAISSSNTGGAWDNAKKFIEEGRMGGKGSDAHKAAVVGDTVGDPLKDTSGPSLNILVKLSAIISLVFARSFQSKGLIPKLFSL